MKTKKPDWILLILVSHILPTPLQIASSAKYMSYARSDICPNDWDINSQPDRLTYCHLCYTETCYIARTHSVTGILSAMHSRSKMCFSSGPQQDTHYKWQGEGPSEDRNSWMATVMPPLSLSLSYLCIFEVYTQMKNWSWARHAFGSIGASQTTRRYALCDGMQNLPTRRMNHKIEN